MDNDFCSHKSCFNEGKGLPLPPQKRSLQIHTTQNQIALGKRSWMTYCEGGGDIIQKKN